MDLQRYEQELQECKRKLDSGRIDEIPLIARPKMVEFDCEKESFVVVSYSRKDFEKVYVFLRYLSAEGYRFWYDNGMIGTDKWIDEFRNKYEHPNCLGTITFFSEQYISDATQEELSVIYEKDHYKKQNMLISLIPLADINTEKILINTIYNGRITIENAAKIKPVLETIVAQEKEKTIHRYHCTADVLPLAEKVEKLFCIRDKKANEDSKKYYVEDDVFCKYFGNEEKVCIPQGISVIGEGAFASCLNVDEVVIPEGVTKIEEAAFDNCISLTEITLPESVEYVWDGAFRGCMSLKRFSAQKGLRLIGENAFDGCLELEEVMLPDGLIDIYHGAFQGCDSLASITIPQSVTFIGNYAFEGCDSLEVVLYQGTKAQWNRIDIGEDTGIHFVKCADGMIELP